LTEEYKKVYDAYALKKRAELKERKASKISVNADSKPVQVAVKAETKKAPVVAKESKKAPVVAATKVT
jgi:hypothetical protein